MFFVYRAFLRLAIRPCACASASALADLPLRLRGRGGDCDCGNSDAGCGGRGGTKVTAEYKLGRVTQSNRCIPT